MLHLCFFNIVQPPCKQKYGWKKCLTSNFILPIESNIITFSFVPQFPHLYRGNNNLFYKVSMSK